MKRRSVALRGSAPPARERRLDGGTRLQTAEYLDRIDGCEGEFRRDIGTEGREPEHADRELVLRRAYGPQIGSAEMLQAKHQRLAGDDLLERLRMRFKVMTNRRTNELGSGAEEASAPRAPTPTSLSPLMAARREHW